jgi:hypothetical protein
METKTYDNNNSGALSHPDLTGSAEVDGKEYWFKGWKKTSKAGKAFLSVSFDPKEAKPDVVSSGVAPMSDDPISF